MFNQERLSRNYHEQPLKRKEPMNREDLIYLYLELNLCLEEISKIIGKGPRYVKGQCDLYGLVKSKEMHKQSLENMYMRRFGVKNPAQLKSSQEKMKKTMMERYGVENIAHSKEHQQRKKQTCLEKYGVDNPAKAQIIKDKTRVNNIQKYGVDYPTQLEQTKEKAQKTCLERFGVAHAMKNPDIIAKEKETNRQRYGTDFASQLDEYKNKGKITSLQKYGTSNVMKLDEYKNKTYETKRKNGTFNSSKGEKIILNKLKQYFSDIKTQHKTEKYPWKCDFYIPQLDLYIEYQGFVSHGGCPYDANNPEHQKRVKMWEALANNKTGVCLQNGKRPDTMYKAMLTTWTISDVEKRTWAKEHNLNWVEFFCLDDFDMWFYRLRKEIK